ncbi:hypothetical protein QVL85_16585 [Klebsiella pneumoniae]|uniref:hypothetical protein n=1 Tax=Klebsiella pneumoniae TaxID=573 RepID=UPI001D0D1113|nr:hypothetical protein [Klebsiella pneumoniae]MDF6052444.1 hypothetical protein [Klebsiella pneumoniae]MDF6072885.1 hypothetical protein [Klebsiella pneumoniae]MDF6081708.1 hypothetical protein [Klebsiella pneumoniae]CAE6238789.1 hypothetical protein AI2649V1_1729 [Klebsiella pneumoniae]CAE6238953.1 hypothetical protein AI2652V1_1753 [Klebsiella pneumoniae]
MTKSTITRERLSDILEFGSGRLIKPISDEEIELMARIALAAMDSEPVAWTWHYREQWHVTNDKCRAEFVATDGDVAVLPLYRHAQPALVGNEFIPKNLDRALGVLGMALPESKEEFNLQSERWIQRLIDRVIRYADEFQEQPTPVVPEEWTITHAVKFCKETGRQDAGTAMDAWNACRAAMLQAGTLTNEDTRQVDELTMWIKRLVRSLKKASPDSKLHSEAMDYLTAKGLISVGVGGALR